MMMITASVVLFLFVCGESCRPHRINKDYKLIIWNQKFYFETTVVVFTSCYIFVACRQIQERKAYACTVLCWKIFSFTATPFLSSLFLPVFHYHLSFVFIFNFLSFVFGFFLTHFSVLYIFSCLSFFLLLFLFHVCFPTFFSCLPCSISFPWSLLPVFLLIPFYNLVLLFLYVLFRTFPCCFYLGLFLILYFFHTFLLFLTSFFLPPHCLPPLLFLSVLFLFVSFFLQSLSPLSLSVFVLTKHTH